MRGVTLDLFTGRPRLDELLALDEPAAPAPDPVATWATPRTAPDLSGPDDPYFDAWRQANSYDPSDAAL